MRIILFKAKIPANCVASCELYIPCSRWRGGGGESPRSARGRIESDTYKGNNVRRLGQKVREVREGDVLRRGIYIMLVGRLFALNWSPNPAYPAILFSLRLLGLDNGPSAQIAWRAVDRMPSASSPVVFTKKYRTVPIDTKTIDMAPAPGTFSCRPVAGVSTAGQMTT